MHLLCVLYYAMYSCFHQPQTHIIGSTNKNAGLDKSITKRLIFIAAVFVSVMVFLFVVSSNDNVTIAMLPKKVDQLWEYAQTHGWITPVPNFDSQYPMQFPEVRVLQENWEIMREEVDALMANSASEELIGNFRDLGEEVWSEPTKWKTVFFKVGGQMVTENYHLAPRTAKLIEAVPNAYLSFFSVLLPDQHIIRHFGPYKGLTKYHLGIRVPKNNAEKSCFMRVNPAVCGPVLTEENKNRLEEDANTTTLKYYYKEGEGMFFDDTYLHDSHNYDKHEPRIVLFVDFARPGLPWVIDKINKIVLFFAMKQPYFAGWRKAAIHGRKPAAQKIVEEHTILNNPS